jgi:hypothetical protein
VSGVVDEGGDLIRYKVKPHFKGQTRDKRNGEIYGEFLSSRFSKALGFFADDEWVADVTCPDCEKSLTSKFQGAPFEPVQPAAGVELPLGKGIDVKCSDKDSAPLDVGLFELQREEGHAQRLEGQRPAQGQRRSLHRQRQERRRHLRRRRGAQAAGRRAATPARSGEGQRHHHQSLPRLAQPRARPARGGVGRRVRAQGPHHHRRALLELKAARALREDGGFDVRARQHARRPHRVRGDG